LNIIYNILTEFTGIIKAWNLIEKKFGHVYAEEFIEEED